MNLDHKPSPLAREIFDQLQHTNAMAASYLKLGRQQMARDVVAWIQKTGVHTFGTVPIGELIALCSKESQ